MAMSKYEQDFNCGSAESMGTLSMRPAMPGWGPGSSARCGRARQRRRSGTSLFQALCGRSSFGHQPEAGPEQQQLPAQGTLRLVIELVIQDDEEEAA